MKNVWYAVHSGEAKIALEIVLINAGGNKENNSNCYLNLAPHVDEEDDGVGTESTAMLRELKI